MWSHYTNSFCGYCVEYEVNKKEFLFPVLYTKKRVISYGEIKNKLVKRNFKKICMQEHRCSSEEEYFQYLLFIRTFKSKIWEYEKEVRLIEEALGGSQYKDIERYGLKVSKIIVGYKCKYISDLKQISKKLNVNVSVMKPIFKADEYAIVEEDL